MTSSATSRSARIDESLRRAVEAGAVPGVAALATDRSAVIYQGAFGQRVLGEPAAMTTDTVGWMASLTKALTSAGVMQLVEQGKLALDAPAAQVVPDIAAIQVLDGFDADGKPRMRVPKRPITLRHLLTHTAGFGHELWSEDLTKYMAATGIPSISTCQKAALRTAVLFDAGDRWLYGISMDWAGMMVEAATGKRLGAYLTDNLFAPLGMKSTAFKITPDMRSRLAKVHLRGEDGKLTPLDFEVPQEAEFDQGGTGLYGTADDYLKFVRMILNRGKAEGGQVLKPETVDLMSRNAMGNARVGVLKTTMSAYSGDVEFFPGIEKTWGLGFQINEAQAPTGCPAGGLMWGGLANTYYWIDHTNGIGGVYVTQVFPFVDEKSLSLYYAFESAFYA